MEQKTVHIDLLLVVDTFDTPAQGMEAHHEQHPLMKNNSKNELT